MDFPAEHYFQTATQRMRQAQYLYAVNEIYKLWANNYRFASEERLRSHLKRITGYQKIKGNYLKEQTRQFLSSAQKFIDKRVVQWQA